jgi:hypothetical protein
VVAHVLVLRRLSDADLWIKPDTSGRGVAGGQKFVVGKERGCRTLGAGFTAGAPQVFYKFATTVGGIYPSAAAAHKAAALEITAMNAVVGSNNTQMTVTLTALFLLCGHCVIATAKAPIDGGRSLVYGSGNAARPCVRGSRTALRSRRSQDLLSECLRETAAHKRATCVASRWGRGLSGAC